MMEPPPRARGNGYESDSTQVEDSDCEVEVEHSYRNFPMELNIEEMSEDEHRSNKMKAKVSKDCGQIANEIGDVRAATDEVARSKASAEKSQRSLSATLNELTKKIEEVNLNLGDFEAGKRRITVENAALLRQLQELNANASLMTKTKSALVSALDEQKAIADNEVKERVSLLGKFRNMEHT